MASSALDAPGLVGLELSDFAASFQKLFDRFNPFL